MARSVISDGLYSFTNILTVEWKGRQLQLCPGGWRIKENHEGYVFPDQGSGFAAMPTPTDLIRQSMQNLQFGNKKRI